ncbi:MAG: biotin--[acetyl-CoA-carboxylase] ligase, partial [Planctomycetota bacterium]
NDVLIGGRKVSGILVETLGDWAMIGIGVNVSGAPETLPPDDRFEPPRATSLVGEGLRVDRLGLLDVLLSRLNACLFGVSDDDLREGWRSRSSLMQVRITLVSDGERLTGRVVDIDPLQGLMVQVDRGGVVTVEAEKATLLSG